MLVKGEIVMIIYDHPFAEVLVDVNNLEALVRIPTEAAFVLQVGDRIAAVIGGGAIASSIRKM